MTARIDMPGIEIRNAAPASKDELRKDAPASAAVERNGEHDEAAGKRPLARVLARQISADRLPFMGADDVNERMRFRLESQRRRHALIDLELRRRLDERDDLRRRQRRGCRREGRNEHERQRPNGVFSRKHLRSRACVRPSWRSPPPGRQTVTAADSLDKRERVVFCWSGGKDSALALHRILGDERYRVVSLLTTVNERFARVSMHGVRLELAQAQAREIGLPLDIVFVSAGTNDEYEQTMAAHLLAHRDQGVSSVAFGDIFLEDLRRWREERLAQIGMGALFPLWKLDTRKVIGEFIDLGFGSVVCCVSDAYLDKTALGRRIDWDFINALPRDVDPCGENGEFHTFAYAGPIFKNVLRWNLERLFTSPLSSQPVEGGSAPTSTHASPKDFGFAISCRAPEVSFFVSRRAPWRL